MDMIDFFGVKVPNIRTTAVHDALLDGLSGKTTHTVVTPNPEILLAARKNPEYAALLNSATVRLPDGAGVVLLSPLQERITGADTAEWIMHEAQARSLPVACIIREDGRSSVEALQDAIEEHYPQLSARVFAVPKTASLEDVPVLLEELIHFGPQVVLVGLGFPEQEAFVMELADSLPSMGVGMAIGGTFDYWTGVAKRAPRFVQRLSLEWLWRLVTEPKRIVRIFRATVIFPLLYLLKQ